MSTTRYEKDSDSNVTPEDRERIARKVFVRLGNASERVLWAVLLGHGSHGYNAVRKLSKEEFPMTVGEFTVDVRNLTWDKSYSRHILSVRSGHEDAPELMIVLAVSGESYVGREFYMGLPDDTLAFLGTGEWGFSSREPSRYPHAIHLAPTLDERGRERLLARFSDVSRALEEIFPATGTVLKDAERDGVARTAEKIRRATAALMNF